MFVAVTTPGPALVAVTVTVASPDALVFALPALNVPRVVENVIGEFATAALFFFQLTVTATGVPSATSVFAAGAVNTNASADTLTLIVACMPSALAVSVSTPLLFAVKLNDALPVASVMTGVCEMPLALEEVIVTDLFAMPAPPPVVSTTLYLPRAAGRQRGRPVERERGSGDVDADGALRAAAHAGDRDRAIRRVARGAQRGGQLRRSCPS